MAVHEAMTFTGRVSLWTGAACVTTWHLPSRTGDAERTVRAVSYCFYFRDGKIVMEHFSDLPRYSFQHLANCPVYENISAVGFSVVADNLQILDRVIERAVQAVMFIAVNTVIHQFEQTLSASI